MTPPELPDLRPTIDDVAELLRARTKDSEGREVGTFNDDTRPTAEQVEAQIDSAVELVGLRLPAIEDVPEQFAGAIRELVAYRAALRIEKSYFPEQVRSDRSPYEQLAQEYADDLQALLDALAASSEDPAGAAGHRAHSEWTPTFLAVFGSRWRTPDADHWPEPENPANWRVWNQPPREPPLPEDLPVGDEPASGWPA